MSVSTPPAYFFKKDYLLNEFQGIKALDRDYFLSQEKISAFYVHYLDNEPYVVLGCLENRIKLIRDSEQVCSYPLDSNLLSMIPYNDRASVFNTRAAMNKDMLCGLSNGTLVCVHLTPTEIEPLWTFQTEWDSGIIELHAVDFRSTGMNDMCFFQKVLWGQKMAKLLSIAISEMEK